MLEMTSVYSKFSFLFAEGVLWSLGANNWSQLGRPTSNTVSTTFGQVSIVEPILELACGMVHCLARTAERVRYARLMVGVTFKGPGD